MKILGTIITIICAVLACAVFAGRAHGQTTRPAMTGVWQQTAESIPKWAPVSDVFVIWSSSRNTQGRDLVKDRAEQLAWRAAVRAAGRKYIDWPTPNLFQAPPTGADVKAMVDDPACYGIAFSDEPDQTVRNPVTGAWDTFRVPVDQYKAWASIYAVGDPSRRLIRYGTFTGMGITPNDGANLPKYAGYFDKLDMIATDWYPRNTNAARYLLTYPALAVSLTRRAAPTKLQGAFLECSWQNIATTGANPTGDDIRAEAKAMIDGGRIDLLTFFPQRIGGGYVGDNTTAEQFAVVGDVARMVRAQSNAGGTPAPQPPADVDPTALSLAAVRTELAATRTDVAALAAQVAVMKSDLAALPLVRIKPPTTQSGN